MSDKKYTLGEAAAIGMFTPIILGVFGVISLPFSLWKAYVLSVLWGWFIVPYFHLPEFSVWVFYGLMIFTGLWTGDSSIKKDQPENNWTATLSSMVVGPALSLLIGYLIHHFALHAA